jgi:hypothetical protein
MIAHTKDRATSCQHGTSQSWVSVASSSDGTRLLAADWRTGHGDYIYTSWDSGVTWTQTGTQQSWASVASSADGTNLVAAAGGFYTGYIYTSADSSATWTQHSW